MNYDNEEIHIPQISLSLCGGCYMLKLKLVLISLFVVISVGVGSFFPTWFNVDATTKTTYQCSKCKKMFCCFDMYFAHKCSGK